MGKADERLDALTGLRFLAAACIIVHHSQGSFGFPVAFGFGPGLVQAVSFFFVLSGFILAYNYPDLSAPGDWKRFWLARWARVWPAHVAVLIVMAALLPWRSLDTTPSPSLTAFALNLALVHAWYPAWNSYYSFNAPSWSISAEWAFYLCFPMLITNWHRTWHLKLAATFALAFGTVMACNGLHLPYQVPESWTPQAYGLVYANPACNLFAFTLGMALVPVIRRLRSWHWGSVAGTGLELLALVAVIDSVAKSFDRSQRFIIFYCPWLGASGLQWLVQGTISLPVFTFLILVMGLGRGWCSRLMARPLMVVLGEISFSLYLVHAPLRKWYLVNYSAVCCEPNLFAYVGWIVLSLGLAYVNWRFVERPCRRLLIGLWPRSATPQAPAVVPMSRAA